ncbi:MAG: type I 3-dehydroquinate dehydratase [Prevotellaceae bacterium]|jgi:shikimate dehydrogenase/3-dehydroquinate dehydratase type I|nr:type I 3-dehydroquinate dehydratase [Prevotellaceae bacterium]
MICTCIAQCDFETCRQALAACEMAEIRLDTVSCSPAQIVQLFGRKNIPLIATFRSNGAGDAARFEALQTAINAGAAYVDIETDAPYLTALMQEARKAKCKVILSYHDFERTPGNDELQCIVAQMRALQPDFMKIVTYAHAAADAERILSLYKTEKNLLAFCMGKEGQSSRIKSRSLGAPFIYAAPDNGVATAAGQLTVSQIKQSRTSYFVPRISYLVSRISYLVSRSRASSIEKTHFALTGISIAHSKSPQLFAAAYPHTANYSYGLLPAQSAGEAIRLFRLHRLQGMNVTMPFKKEIVPFTDVQSEEVKVIGAANTIVNRDGRLHAYNTDVHGVVNSFLQHGITIKNNKALVLGAGGAGQAAAYALANAGAEVWWANRTIAKVEALAERYHVRPLSFSCAAREWEECRIIVNTLPAGADFLHTLHFHKHQTVLDADYAGRPLYRQAIAGSAGYISGLSWLLWQAVPAFELFTGVPPDVEAMKKTVFV